MGYCPNCGVESQCTCNRVGCIGRIVLAIGYSVIGIIFVTVIFFVVPGLVFQLLAGNHVESDGTFLANALDDNITWVVSAVFWIGLALLWFHVQTRIPKR